MHLVQQGIRFADLGRVAGRLSGEALAHYATLAPQGVRRGVDEIDLLLPALRALESNGDTGGSVVAA